MPISTPPARSGSAADGNDKAIAHGPNALRCRGQPNRDSAYSYACYSNDLYFCEAIKGPHEVPNGDKNEAMRS